jgi:hypothetical protein
VGIELDATAAAKSLRIAEKVRRAHPRVDTAAVGDDEAEAVLVERLDGPDVCAAAEDVRRYSACAVGRAR